MLRRTVQSQFAGSIDCEEDDDSEGFSDDNVEAPGSPGMECLLREKNEENKKLPKNVKFNKSFDVAKMCADYLKNAPSQTFQTYFDCFISFSRFLRDGMPTNVVDFLMDPTKYDIVLKEYTNPEGEEEFQYSETNNQKPNAK